MTELMVAFPTALVYESQAKAWEMRARKLYGKNGMSAQLRDLLSSKEAKAFFSRRWREERARFEKGE